MSNMFNKCVIQIMLSLTLFDLNNPLKKLTNNSTHLKQAHPICVYLFNKKLNVTVHLLLE